MFIIYTIVLLIKDEGHFKVVNYILIISTISVVVVIIENIERDYIEMRDQYKDNQWFAMSNKTHMFNTSDKYSNYDYNDNSLNETLNITNDVF